jgi:hypothetical protein
LGGIAAASLLSFAMGHFMPLVRLLRWFNSQRRTYAVGKWVLGGAANGGNGGEADNSAATIAVAIVIARPLALAENSAATIAVAVVVPRPTWRGSLHTTAAVVPRPLALARHQRGCQKSQSW